ncbi:putative DsbA family dithiol-disulfide isomerase OS=Ureibacillus acetophenoni OX=614649 GN=SAMN05877842_11630 PE=4 SV=1 [Ureibacillus acetophenoni]
MVNKNNMVCDMETGVCGVVEDEGMEVIDLNASAKKTIDLYYVTDPICSHCWALEPTLRRFKEEYGHYFNFHTVMGGLLEKWHDGPIDPGNGISRPSDVAGHWREVGEHTRMPIVGTLWYDNPVQSSFPPSQVFKVIQAKHSDDKANEFLRRFREQLFAFNENIAERDRMIELVNGVGLEGEAIVEEALSSVGVKLLHEDFALARNLGVRGFPTIILVNEENKGVKIVGSRPYINYVAGLNQVLDGNVEAKAKARPSLSELLLAEKLLFSKEIEVMYYLEQSAVQAFVEKEVEGSKFEVKEVLGEKYWVVVA